jgi:hypothetical protein
MALTPGLQLPFGIQPLNPVPVDAWSGPHEGVTEAAAMTAANAAIPPSVRFKSMEVRLIINGASAKYWYKDGTANSDLVSFSQSATLPSAATFTTSVSSPALSGSFFGDGSGLTGLYAKIREQDTTTIPVYTLSSLDINSILTINNGTNETTIALDQYFNTSSKIGTQLILLQLGTGTVTVSSSTNQVTIISSYNRYKIVGQNSSAALIKISDTSWFLGGDIAV